jgi:Tfp pilus assembly protein PilV
MNSKSPARNEGKRMRITQRGFTLVELALATVVLMVGLVGVMQLVPAAINLNLTNRNDTSATVIVQRLRDLMVNQPVSVLTLADPTGAYPCGTTVVCNLGGGALNGDFVAGAPLLASGNIDFTAAPVANYSFNYTDPNDPSGTPYDVRWAVVTNVRTVGPTPNVVVGKRFVVGARRLGAGTPAVSTFSSWVSR